MRTALAALLLSVFAAGGCAASHDPRCKKVCEKEARCAEKLEGVAGHEDYEIDESECTAACDSLIRKKESAEQVDRHIACVDRAGDDCTAIAACSDR